MKDALCVRRHAVFADSVLFLFAMNGGTRMPVNRKREERVKEIAGDLRRWGDSTAGSICQRTGFDKRTIDSILRKSDRFVKVGKDYRSVVWSLVGVVVVDG